MDSNGIEKENIFITMREEFAGKNDVLINFLRYIRNLS